MATEEELTQQMREEAQKLSATWSKLYVVDDPESDETEAKISEDMFHSPPGLRRFVDDVIFEVCASINKRMETSIADGSLEPGMEAFDFAMNGFASMMRMVSIRMYEIGQHLHNDLPYHSMVPCRCRSLVDDEIEQLLSGPYHLEGDGFVIVNFDVTKASKMMGKAYWL